MSYKEFKNNVSSTYIESKKYNDVIYKSRYTNTLRVLSSDMGGDLTKTYHSTYSTNDYTISDSDKYFKVTAKEENRLDLVASYYYNDPYKYWIIAYVNNIIDCFTLPIGTILRIPMDITNFL